MSAPDSPPAAVASSESHEAAHPLCAPSVSIVIPAFNSDRFLGSTLRSVQEQSLTDWECVVVDDGSTDSTSEIAREFAAQDSRFRVVRIDNSGPSAARNHGYRLTSPGSEFVTFLDSDDVWLPHALATLASRLRSDSAAVGAHGLAEVVDEDGHPIPGWSYPDNGRHRLGLEVRRLVVWPLDKPTDFAVLVNGNVLFPPGLLLARRGVYERAGRFDEWFRGAEDWDMLIRISRFGHLSFVNEVILHYRRHGANLGAAQGIERRAWLVRCKAFYSPENDATQQRIARRGWRAYQRYMVGKRWHSSLAHLRDRQVRRSADQLVRIPFHLVRFVRGHPTPKLIRVSEPWERSGAGDATPKAE